MTDNGAPQSEAAPVPPAESAIEYRMRISRQTVDKLGVKLYDSVSAVVAELIANAYDADAEAVYVRLPLASVFTAGALDPNLNFIEVYDDGHGMTPSEANEHFLVVGKNRRDVPGRATSRSKGRPVLGRKGIGKLAPFGICKTIEVRSAGGPPGPDGKYLVSHFTLRYDDILEDTDAAYAPTPGPDDKTWSAVPGTIIRLTDLNRKRVPDEPALNRQLAVRFGPGVADFAILIEDTREDEEHEVRPVSIPLQEGTRIDVASRPVPVEEGVELSVAGWVGMARKPYKHAELAGVRVYSRGKIVSTTRDFGQMSGFTSEFRIRSYLVGEIHADWLDADDGEDLIRTDRQDILWDSVRGRALRDWGAELTRDVGRLSRKPMRESAAARFMAVSDLAARAQLAFSDERVAEVAVELGRQIGRFAAEDELLDEDYVNGLADVVLTVAPHKALMDAYREFHLRLEPSERTIDSMADLFTRTRLAELASYAQIVAERVDLIEELEGLIDASARERALQGVIAKAPWLIDPTFSVMTADETLRTAAQRLKEHLRAQGTVHEDFEIAVDYRIKRPDLTAVQVGQRFILVELKARGHDFDERDFGRLNNYVLATHDFFAQHGTIAGSFPNGWRILLIADDVSIEDPAASLNYDHLLERGWVHRMTWNDLLFNARQANEAFLRIARNVRQEGSPTDLAAS